MEDDKLADLLDTYKGHEIPDMARTYLLRAIIRSKKILPQTLQSAIEEATYCHAAAIMRIAMPFRHRGVSDKDLLEIGLDSLRQAYADAGFDPSKGNIVSFAKRKMVSAFQRDTASKSPPKPKLMRLPMNEKATAEIDLELLKRLDRLLDSWRNDLGKHVRAGMLRMKLGFTGEALSFAEIGKRYGVPRERTRARCRRALREAAAALSLTEEEISLILEHMCRNIA